MRSLPAPWTGKLLFLLPVVLATANPPRQSKADYSTVFSKDYRAAISFIQENSWINDTLTHYGIATKEAWSMVFPELLRYSQLSDDVETAALEVLYIQWGRQYADFSIGRFQMKPSFALHIEKDMEALLPGIDCSDSAVSERSSRVDRLTDLQWQVKYLVLVYKYLDQKYAAEHWKSADEKVQFYAAAYNCGYWMPKAYIRNMMGRSFFRIAELSTTAWRYADIAGFYFRQ